MIPTRRRVVRGILIAFAVVMTAGLVASWVVAGALVAPNRRSVGNPPTDLPADSISLSSDSGSTIAGWHVATKDSHGVVVLLHGIHGCRQSMLERARLLHAAGYSVVLIDFQSHGESPGQQVTVGHLEKHDARAAVEFARRTHPNEPIAVIGTSLGGASALLASPLRIDALVVESVYPTISQAVHNRVSAQLGPLSFVPAELLLIQLKLRLGISRSQLRPIDSVGQVGCPIYIMSGSDDRHTTEAESRLMFAAAHEPKQLWIVNGAAHVDLQCHSPDEYKRRLLQFLKQTLRNNS